MVTEVQTPTDHWSGLGFSKSMPAEAVKELRNVSRRSYKPYLSDGSASQQLVGGRAHRSEPCASLWCVFVCLCVCVRVCTCVFVGCVCM